MTGAMLRCGGGVVVLVGMTMYGDCNMWFFGGSFS
jgi:hypothetical protein